jgi:GNAT superfamily N-acetyltransferase
LHVVKNPVLWEYSTMLSIRPAQATDVPLLKKMIHEFAAFERLPVATTEADLTRDGFGDQPKFRVLIAESDTQPAGYAFFFEYYSTFHGRHGLFLEDIYVRSQFRGKGIGRALFACVAAIAQQENCFGLRWQVLDWNTSAIDFYQKLGATFLDEWKTLNLEGDPLDRLARSATI